MFGEDSKLNRKKLIIEIMEEDAKDGLYDTKQQTAVEKMIQDIEDLITICTYPKWVVIKSKILEMEKRQIEMAYIQGVVHPLEMDATKQAEQYYNETYGKE